MLPVVTLTVIFVQSVAVPTPQSVRSDVPGASPAKLTCVPFTETVTMVGAEFAST